MQRISSIAVGLCCLWALLALPTGCGGGHKTYYEPSTTERFYTPHKIQIRPGLIRKPEFEICKQVTLLNVQTRQEMVPIGAYTHKWYANLHRWTDSAVGVTRQELQNRGVTVMGRAPKVLKLAVTEAELFWEFRKVGCRLNLQVITGDGYVIDFPTTSKSTDLYDACDSAMTKAVANMFDHDAVRDYLTCPEIPRDSDCDGVPDEFDACSDTPRGAPVDEKGCQIRTSK